MRVMASSAILTTAFARVGFSGDYGGAAAMAQLVGSAKARGLCLSDRVSANEALQGLANWVVEPSDGQDDGNRKRLAPVPTDT